MGKFSVAGLLLVLGLFLPGARQAAEPAPVPPAEEQEQTRKLLRDLFRTDYANRTARGMNALAVKLLQFSKEEGKGSAMRFVLLDEARDLAARAGEPALALEAVAALTRHYRVDALKMRQETVETAGRSASSPATSRELAEAYLALMEDLAKAEEYDAAKGLASRAQSAARKARDQGLYERLQALDKEIGALRAEYGRVKPSLQTLQENPNDPEANLAAGTYFCFTRDQWDRGLPHLARGSDPGLAELAAAELGKPETPESQAELARQWREAARKKTARVKSGCEQRALYWYEKALQGTRGVGGVELRQEVERFWKSLPPGEIPVPGLAFWVEPGRSPGAPLRDLQNGLRGENDGCALAPSGPPAIVCSPKNSIVYPAAGPVASVSRNGSIFVWLKTDDAAQFGCVVNRCENQFDGPEDFGLYVRAGRLNVYFNWERPDKAPIGSSTGALTNGKWRLGGITWDEGSLTFYLDGKKDGAIPLNGNTALSRGSKVVLGVSVPGGPGGVEYYTGLLGSAMIFGRTLSDLEVERLYAATFRRFP